MMTRRIAFTVNGKEHILEVDVRESLLDVLRNRLALTGVKKAVRLGNVVPVQCLLTGNLLTPAFI